jgi:microcystin-dependent protein
MDVVTLALAKKTAEEQSNGVPVGSIISYLGATDPSGWFICDGRDTTGTAIKLETHYPKLYEFLGNSNVLPDLRECTLVGAGQNSTDTIADHDVYTVGEFKDDQMQGHWHNFFAQSSNGSAGTVGAYMTTQAGNTNFTSSVKKAIADGTNGTPRTGTTTHGKQFGVNYIIKAV